MHTDIRDITIAQIIVGVLFIILPVCFPWLYGMHCKDCSEVYGFWTQWGSQPMLSYLTGFMFAFNAGNALFAILLLCFSLQNNVGFGWRMIVKSIILLQLCLFPFWAFLDTISDFNPDGCRVHFNYKIGGFIYVLIGILHVANLYLEVKYRRNSTPIR